MASSVPYVAAGIASGGLSAVLPYVTSIGSSYSEALNDGATGDQALLNAIISGVPQAMIENAGGIQKIFGKIKAKGITSALESAAKQGNESLVKQILKSALEEGAEEVAQYSVGSAAKKAIYDNDMPLYSTTGTSR